MNKPTEQGPDTGVPSEVPDQPGVSPGNRPGVNPPDRPERGPRPEEDDPEQEAPYIKRP